jgi:protein SCO1/2
MTINKIVPNLPLPAIRRPRLTLLRWGYLIGGLILAGIVAFATVQPVQVLPRIGLSPGFLLTDQNGQLFSSEDLRGQLVLYNFTYSRCTGECPQTSGLLQAVQARLPTLDTGGLSVRLVTISFDPAFDTPDRLRAYAQALGADPQIWHFVTGDAAQLKTIIGNGFGVSYQPNGEGVFTFTPALALVDGLGIVRAHYQYTLPDLTTLERDLALVAAEVQSAEGALRFAYEAAHLFACYPR